MFFQKVTHLLRTSNTLSMGEIAFAPLARAKPPVDVTTGYQQNEPANVADVGGG